MMMHGPLNVKYESIARLSRPFSGKLCMKVRDCLYFHFGTVKPALNGPCIKRNLS